MIKNAALIENLVFIAISIILALPAVALYFRVQSLLAL